MIAKHVAMRTVKKSDFAELVQYIEDHQDKEERVGYVLASNCHSENPNAAVLEVLNVQSRNTRATSDKTYHLIVSFRAGEQPNADTLRAIEARICDGLGYGEHQRVSAVHYDTDNLHIHIAINKIHPTRFTIYTPYNDHKMLGALCERLEREYGLERDNHQAQKRGAENRAADMERHAGIESLLGWIKRECLDDLKAAQSWAEFHSALADNGLSLVLRGNGLVITDTAGTMVKASSVAREFSKGKLEANFGPFKSSAEAVASKPARRYEARPVRLRIDTSALYARYKAEQQTLTSSRAAELERARDNHKQLIETAKRTGRLKRAVIKLMGGSAQSKRLLYAMASQSLGESIRHINNRHRAERQSIYARHERKTWADWLRRQAIHGDRQALEALRAREAAQTLQGNTLTATGSVAPSSSIAVRQDSITKKGTAIFTTGAAVIRDDGKRLKISKGLDDQAAHTALLMAMERYGSHLSVTGTDEFKAQIVKVSALAQLPVSFADSELEQRRKVLMNESSRMELATPARQSKSPPGDVPEITPTAWAAADTYIQERNRTRSYVADVLEHKRYTDSDDGTLAYGGLRLIEGQALALLRKDDTVLVLPVNEATAAQWRRRLVGDAVSIRNGVLQRTKGRSR